MFRFHGKIDVVRTMHDHHGMDMIQLFEPTSTSAMMSSSQSSDSGSDNKPRRWSLNPNWQYCTYIRSTYTELLHTQEDELLHFMRRMKMGHGSWKWRNTGEGLLGKFRHQNNGGGGGNNNNAEVTNGGDIYRCKSS